MLSPKDPKNTCEVGRTAGKKVEYSLLERCWFVIKNLDKEKGKNKL